MGRSKLSNYSAVNVTKLGGAGEEGANDQSPPTQDHPSADQELDCCEGDGSCSGPTAEGTADAQLKQRRTAWGEPPEEGKESQVEPVESSLNPDPVYGKFGDDEPDAKSFPDGPGKQQGGAPRSRRSSYASTTSSSSVSSSGSSSSSDDESESDNMSQASTTELLGGDPLFLVLSQFFMTNSGRSIADILDDISISLRKIAKAK